MNTLRLLWLLLAPDALANKAGNVIAPDAVKETSEIMDNFELPRTSRGGARGSKYVDNDIATKIEKMQPAQGIIVPFMQGVDPKRHRAALSMVIDKWAKAQAVAEEKEGDKVLKAAVPAPKFSVAVIQKDGKDVGIGIRRNS